jgi:hypothetical protein
MHEQPFDSTSITVRYATTREDVWRYYWRAWARLNGLWRVHVAVGVLAVAIVYAVRGPGLVSSFNLTMAGVAGFLTALVLFPLWPLLRFKPQQRVLTIRATGLTTTIGSLHGELRWSDITTIRPDEQNILIVDYRSNAFVVPNRAFEDEAQRVEFVEAARRWRAAGARSAGRQKRARHVLQVVAMGVAVLAFGWFVLRGPLPFVDSWWQEGAKDWADPYKKRHRIADGLLLADSLIGMNRDQIVQMLGVPPDAKRLRDGVLVYPLGAERGFNSTHHEWLVILLDAHGVAFEARLVRA